MVRLYQHKDEVMHGSLVLDRHPQGSRVDVSYVPPPLRLAECGIDPDDAAKYTTKLLELEVTSGLFTIYPINTMSSGDGFLKPKYKQVRKIVLADGKPVLSRGTNEIEASEDYARSLTFGPTQLFTDEIDKQNISESPKSAEQILRILEGLPAGFTKDYDYGLGFAHQYRFIVEAIEDLTNCTEIIISRIAKTGADETGKAFCIATDDFETVRKMLNSTTRMSQVAGRTVKYAETHNFFAEIIGQAPIPIKMGRHRLRKVFTTAMLNDDAVLSEEEQEVVIGAITRSMRSISESSPDRLARLQNDIELVNLESLIDRFESMLSGRNLEHIWQQFFGENPFILSLAFGYPIVMVRQQASVGGRKLSGRGEKITDYLVRNRMTNNTAVIEIKTPNTALLGKREFRGGVFAPSKALSESTIQALDQRYQFQRDVSGIKDRSGIHDIESYSVQCCLVIGTTPKSVDEQKSFELFRGNSKDVHIVTFDELLEKLNQFRNLLTSTDDREREVLPEEDVPF